ncbi:MAG: helix-turn-helix transcriptional regulator [Solobacterium sp.]|nr:helix-turn-helix transcriptional regulator [Solobacterium sp.]
MLSENIRVIRKKRGLSQEELAVKLNVVRQTISKWENGLSVPDSELLLRLSDALDTPVSKLLGETVEPAEADDLKVISQKLEVINYQLSLQQQSKRRITKLCFLVCALSIVVLTILLYYLNSSYLEWDYQDVETAVLGVAFHSLEWMFIRIAPVILIGSIAGLIFTKRNAM